MVGHTTVVIARRLPTVRNADQIIALEEGAVEDSGTHQELIERDGLYRYLSQVQMENDSTNGARGGPASDRRAA